jgi:oxygen-dependent protoporphyrinogen oxidase
VKRVVVIGGGISGLALAYRLEDHLPDAEVRLLEQSHRAGGTIDTLRHDGFTIEAGPNGFPDNNPSTLDLARSVGLGDRLQAASESASRNRFLLLDGRLRKLPSGMMTFLASPLLSWRAKLRILTERYRSPPIPQGDESIDAFARRRLGEEIADTFVDAFVTGILAGDPKLLSVRAAFPRLANWERDHRSIFGGMAHARKLRRMESAGRRAGKMWSIQGGLSALVDAIVSRLRTPPIYGVPVRRVMRDGPRWRVEADGRDAWSADAVALCCPAYAQAEILAPLDPELAGLIGAIPYNRVAVVAVGFRREDVPHSLDGFGYLSPQRTRRDVLGVQWCSSIYPDRAPEGMVVLRAMCGGWHRGEMLDWDDDRLVSAVRAELAVSMNITLPPAFVNIVRWHKAIPQYLVGHLERVAAIEARVAAHPGLFVGGNAYRGVALNDCVEQSGLLAARIAAWARNGSN